MNKFIFAFFLSLFPALVFAQGTTVSGQITDKATQAAVPFAQVLLVQLPDSTVKPTQTDADGRFTFTNVPAGRYALKVSFLGNKPFRQVITVAGQPLNVGAINLNPDTKQLKEVEVVGRAAMAVQKGDTSEFNSKAFKTTRDASAEDMVQKVPGITMQNGKIQAQGEDVKQVLVDGKQFFGDDAAAALKNLPAEVIDKIQVFDQQSDQSRFSGVNDGNTTKTLNIVTKPGMRNGKFGKVYAGAGTDDRYQAGGNINFMNGSRRFSIIGQTNNINQQNFSTADILGVTGSSGQGGRGGRGGLGGRPGGGPGGQWGGGGGASDFQVSTRNGIARTHALGLNYADQWGKKVEVTGSYFLNITDNVATENVFRNIVDKQADDLTFAQTSQSDANNINHRFNFRLDWKIDSVNSLFIQPKFTLQQNEGNSDQFGQTLDGNKFLNSFSNDLKTKFLGYNFSNDLIYRHRFAKRGRTFSGSFNTVLNGNTGDRLLLNETLDTTSLQPQIRNQFSDLESSGPTFSTNLSYTEPISQNGTLTGEYNGSFRRNEADQRTYDYSEAEKAYTGFNPGLSNVFSSDYWTQSAGLGYRYNLKDVTVMLRANYQYANLQSQQEFPARPNLKRSFNNVLPMAMLRYNITKEKNLRMFYRTSTNPPSVNQLQNVIDNSNPVLLTTGNPDLKQDYRHFMVARYSSANPGKSTTFFGLVSAEVVQNYIANSTTISQGLDTLPGGVAFPRGSQLTRPVNLQGFYRVRSFVTYGLPLGLIKSNLNLNASATFTRDPGLINGLKNFTNTQSYSAGVVLSSNISENLDFTISANPSYNLVENTQQSFTNNNYFNQSSSLRLNWIFYKGIFLQTDLNHQYYNGLSQGFNQNYLLWNAGIGKKLFKNQLGEIKLTAFDLLHQNNSIQRNVTANYVEDVQTNVLQQYFMLVFTYNIRAFGSGSKAGVPAEIQETSPNRPRGSGGERPDNR